MIHQTKQLTSQLFMYVVDLPMTFAQTCSTCTCVLTYMVCCVTSTWIIPIYTPSMCHHHDD